MFQQTMDQCCKNNWFIGGVIAYVITGMCLIGVGSGIDVNGITIVGYIMLGSIGAVGALFLLCLLINKIWSWIDEKCKRPKQEVFEVV